MVALDKIVTTAATDPRKAFKEFEKAVMANRPKLTRHRVGITPGRLYRLFMDYVFQDAIRAPGVSGNFGF